MSYKSFKLEKDIKSTLNYLVYLPQSYNKSRKWPLILSLHGSGERGNNIETVKKYGIHKILREKDDFPYSNIIFKVYKGAGHEVCTTAYEEPELFQWLLKQKRKKSFEEYFS